MNSQFLINILILLFAFFATPTFSQSKKAVKLYEKGLKAMKTHHYVQASVDFTKAIATSPNYSEAYYQRALSFLGLNRREAAIKDFATCIELDPAYIAAYLNIIYHCKAIHQYEKALSYIDKLAENAPNNLGGAYYQRAICYEEMQDKQQAIFNYTKAIEFFEADTETDLSEAIQECKDKIAALGQ